MNFFTKAYIVMVDYGVEGWRPWAECDDFNEAIERWQEALGQGNGSVEIMKLVKLEIRDRNEDATLK